METRSMRVFPTVITKKGPKKSKTAKNVLLKATKCSVTIERIYFLLRRTA
jgi:hypothetical protein